MKMVEVRSVRIADLRPSLGHAMAANGSKPNTLAPTMDTLRVAPEPAVDNECVYKPLLVQIPVYPPRNPKGWRKVQTLKI